MPFIQEQVSAASENTFHKLIHNLSNVLGPSSGLDSEDVDPLDLQRLMESYVSQDSEWEQYALADTSRHYTRNLVDEGNGKSNLVLASPRSQPGS